MKLAFFDVKPYDRPGFERYADGTGLEIKYFETKLNADTVSLARGFDGVCVFVNDTVDAAVADALYAMGVALDYCKTAGRFVPELYGMLVRCARCVYGLAIEMTGSLLGEGRETAIRRAHTALSQIEKEK